MLYLAATILQKELQANVGIQYSLVNPDEISQDNAEAIITLYNVCSVHQGMFTTSGDTMSTLGEYLEYVDGYHDSCGGAS